MSQQQLFIVTGSSRGMGEAIVHKLLQPGHLVLGIARNENASLAIAARNRGVELLQWQADLSQPLPVATRLREWLQQGLDATRFESIHLINNAALVSPPGPVDSCTLEALSSTVRVGLEAVLLLSAAFLQGTQAWAAERRILNISSGLGRRAMAGAAPYCAIKAGMDHLSSAMSLDGVKVVSLAPGIIDTEMQVQLRSADPALFPEQARFAAFKSEGQLDSPADAAEKVVRYLMRKDFGATVLADVRQA